MGPNRAQRWIIICSRVAIVVVLSASLWRIHERQTTHNHAREVWHLNRPEAPPPNVSTTNESLNTAISAPPQGFYIGKDKQKVFVNYATPDPVLQSFMRSVMSGNYDATAKGREIFLKICAACHQPDGSGKDGLAPPLVGSEWVLAPSGERLVRIVLNGLNGPLNVRGRAWNQPMLPWRNTLDDEQIAVVLTFIRSQLGDNKASAIKPELVATAREEAHPDPESAKELMSIPVQ